MDSETKLETSLKTIFGRNTYLNELQEQAAENILKRKRDIFISGYGKSICYQLPVMVTDNSFIIVITPRVPYMKKYTNYFTSKDITTNYLTNSTTRRKRKLIEKGIISKKSKMKILFITPLQYETAYFKNVLKMIHKERLLGIVIDQADNILSKQENLCNQYQNLDLKIIRVPIIAITSTTSAEVQKDIIKNFHLLNPKVYAMPILRANLYCDLQCIDTMNPMEQLTNFIEKRLYVKIHALYKEEKWGLIVCKDLKTTSSIAKELRSKNISVLLSDTCLNQGKRSKNTNLENYKDVKVVLVCDKDDTLSVTNSLVRGMAPKSLKFIIYWQVLPSIEKYYLLMSRVQCVYEVSFCRVYCQVDTVIDNWMKFSCQNDINNESFSVILINLIKLQCRHNAYSSFVGVTFGACKNRCDMCKNPKKAEEIITNLMKIIDRHNPREKSRQIVPLKGSNKICDENLPYICSQKTVLNRKTEKNVNVRAQTENRKVDHSNVDKNVTKNDEVICENHVSVTDKKRKALSELSDIYSKTWKKMPYQTSSLSSSNVREIDSNKIGKGQVSLSSKRLNSNNENKSSNNPPVTQSSNDRTLNRITKISVEPSETCQRVISIDDQDRQKTIEVITLSDDDTTNPKEVNTLNKKRHHSTVQAQENFKQTKRRKLSERCN